MRNKKLLLLMPDMGLIGGIEIYNKNFCESLDLHGYEYTLINRKKGGILKKINFFISSLIRIFSLKYDFIVCGHLNYSVLLIIAKFFTNKNYSISVYGIELINNKKFIQRKAIFYSKKLVYISKYTHELLSQYPRQKTSELFYLPSSVDDNVFKVIKNREELKKKFDLFGKKVILTLSRLSQTEEKGQDRVLNALSLLGDENFIYLIAGPGHDPRIEGAIEQNPNLKSRVVFLGPVNQKTKIELYNLCDLFILPSKNEGFGIVFIEALSCGAKVISSNGFGCVEGLLDGNLGDFVDPDNIHEIASKVRDSLNDKEYSYKERLDLSKRSNEIYGREKWHIRVKQFLSQI